MLPEKSSSFINLNKCEKLREAAKKALLLMAGPLRGGGGVKGRAIKEKKLFFDLSKISRAIKIEGGGGLGLNGPAIKRRTCP